MEPEILQQPEVPEAKDPGIAGLESMFADLEKRLDALVAQRLDAVEARRLAAERDNQLARFAADNPDFRELRASGALEAQKRGNPVLDDVGAYFAHHLKAARQGADEAVAKARAEAETRTLEQVRSKRLARTLSAAPSGAGRGQGPDPELAAPEKFGGINAVLAARLAARRKSSGN